MRRDSGGWNVRPKVGDRRAICPDRNYKYFGLGRNWNPPLFLLHMDNGMDNPWPVYLKNVREPEDVPVMFVMECVDVSGLHSVWKIIKED